MKYIKKTAIMSMNQFTCQSKGMRRIIFICLWCILFKNKEKRRKTNTTSILKQTFMYVLQFMLSIYIYI